MVEANNAAAETCSFEELRDLVSELDDGVVLSLDLKEVISLGQEDGKSE